MEIDRIIYKAKDGKIFLDPLECEEYEKNIGVLQGSVGKLVIDLESHDPKEYIYGIVLVKDGEKMTLHTRCTICVDFMLEDYVNVDNLPEEKRHVTSTVGELLLMLKMLDKDLPCQYFLLFSDNIKLNHPGAMANYNQDAWIKNDDKKK